VIVDEPLPEEEQVAQEPAVADEKAVPEEDAEEPAVPEEDAEELAVPKEPALQAAEEPEPELQAAEEPGPELQAAEEPGPEQEPEPPAIEPEATPDTRPVTLDPDQVIFRVQILSSSRPNSQSSVTIDGRQYDTFEYYYKGAYRITVGSFATVQEALELRSRCREAGYNQAFVAAFRGNERELDPAVFR